MSVQQQATPRETRWIGAGVTALGLWLTLVGLGLLPLPGGPGNLHGPLWLVAAAGLAFLLAGIAVLLQALGHANEAGELPADAPMWLRVAQYLIGVAIFACFALIGSWVAFGPGPRSFSGSFMFFSGETNASIGRIVFGFGAIICWFGTIAFAVAGARKLLRPGKG